MDVYLIQKSIAGIDTLTGKVFLSQKSAQAFCQSMSKGPFFYSYLKEEGAERIGPETVLVGERVYSIETCASRDYIRSLALSKLSKLEIDQLGIILTEEERAAYLDSKKPA